MGGPTGKLSLSPSEYASLEVQLAEAQDRLRSTLEVADDIMRGWSDHAEKASYAASIDQLRSRVEYLAHRLDSVYPADGAGQLEAADIDTDASTREVGLNSRVVVDFGGEEETYTIVDERDAWAAKGLISSVSPLAVALMGKRAGQSAEFEAPGGETRVTIVRVE